MDRDENPEVQRHTLPVSAPSANAALTDRAPLAPGSIVKHYEIVRELGHGGMGGVFLARDMQLTRLCAIKFMLAHTGAGARRFLAEARATACCKHENIVTVYEVDELHGYPYMVLEYLEGRTLRAWLAARDRQGVPPRLAVELMIPVVRAVVYAHAMSIVHRDLKPENIFLTDAGLIKVLDFGVAKRIDVDEGEPATRSALIGTLPYMAPEQWLGADIDAQADVWAIGVMLYELVTGSHPLAPATMPQLLEVQQLERPMPGVRVRRPDVGPLGAVIDRCLNKHRSERIGSASELLAELEPLLAGREPAPADGRRRMALAGATAALAIAVALGTDALDRVDWGGARATGTAITDVPLPPSRHPEARAAYDAALHGFRDANWAAAENQLRRAVALDPTLAAAHLRLAIVRSYTAGRVAEVRQSYALAVQWRATLSARDRDILATFESLLTREPPEMVRFNAQLIDLARRHSSDAEVLALLAYFGAAGPEVQLRAARRAVEIDPAYADGWQAVGKHLFALGRVDEALRAFDSCLAVSPTSVDCLGERAQVHAARGACAATEADLRNADATNPEGRYWRDLWASSLVTLGKPVETATEVLNRKWAAQPEPIRELVELHDRARLDLLHGDFAKARDRALVLQSRTRSRLDAELHMRYATLLIDLATEADQLADAAQVADDYLRRRDGWVAAELHVDDIAMVTVLRDAGRLTADEFAARRAAWLASHGDLATSMPLEAWLAAWARPATTHATTTRDAALAALAEAPAGELLATVHSIADDAVIGALLLRAGRAGEAIRFLERAARGCDGFLAPVGHVRAAAHLGQAREAVGDRAAACAAYGHVLDRWAAASSATARDAQRRATALGCPSLPARPR